MRNRRLPKLRSRHSRARSIQIAGNCNCRTFVRFIFTSPAEILLSLELAGPPPPPVVSSFRGMEPRSVRINFSFGECICMRDEIISNRRAQLPSPRTPPPPPSPGNSPVAIYIYGAARTSLPAKLELRPQPKKPLTAECWFPFSSSSSFSSLHIGKLEVESWNLRRVKPRQETQKQREVGCNICFFFPPPSPRLRHPTCFVLAEIRRPV